MNKRSQDKVLRDCLCGCGQKILGWGNKAYKPGHRPNLAVQRDQELVSKRVHDVLEQFAEPEPPAEQVTAPVAEQPPVQAAAPEPAPAPAPAPVAPTPVFGPPENGSIDRRLWRLASERSGPKSGGWLKTQCRNCVLPMWTRDPMSLWENGGICEECHFLYVSEMQTGDRRQFQIQARTYHDPFRPRT